MAVVELSIVPVGIESTSVSSFVAGAIKVLEMTSLEFELTAMGTIISGNLDDILKTIRQMHESCFKAGAMRVLTHIKIDDRRDKEGSIEQKVRSVREKLGRDRKIGG